jgi:Uma2 family endonuclease
LLVEVLSPSTRAPRSRRQAERYRHFGVPEYWIVDAEARAVEIWKLSEGADEPIVLKAADQLRWQPVPGRPALELPLEELFGSA